MSATLSTEAAAETDTTCEVFRGLAQGSLTAGAVHRFVVGEDTQMRVLTPEEATAELGDPFATELLLKGRFPRFAGEVVDAFATAGAEGDPLREAKFFLVGDGSQLPVSPETASVKRNMRFLVTLGHGPEGPDVMLSSFEPTEGDVELLAWDRVNGGFNYYQTVGDSSGWVFAGNSRHALFEATEGKGPFEAHPSGNVVMKELSSPWINWHSPAANILDSAFPEGHPLRANPWVDRAQEEPQGAIVSEQLIRRAIDRWTRTRFAGIAANGGVVERPERILRQILESRAVNLISSHTEGGIVETAPTVDLPQTFFVDSEGLGIEKLGLPAPDTAFMVPGAMYAASMETFAVTLTDGAAFSRPGDTHFAFVVPQRAAEDQAVLAAAIDAGLLTDRLAACLLMTDFPNPVFSARRASLLRHVPETATVTNGTSEFSQLLGDAIVAAAEATGPDSPEREFAGRWGVGDGWREVFGAELNQYYAAITERLREQDGLDDVIRLAESRRDHVRGSDLHQRMPISESPLLFARTNISFGERVMRPDATVAEVS